MCPPFLYALCTHITVGAHIVRPENRQMWRCVGEHCSPLR
nr:MAG TPA: Prion-like protein, doppel, scrapie, Prion Protein [Caudoviricetes sp.]